jgi:hypothetical protein
MVGTTAHANACHAVFCGAKKWTQCSVASAKNAVLEKLDRLNGTPRRPHAASITDYRDRFIKCQSSNAFGQMILARGGDLGW